jgi:hypothetical protein
MNEYLSFYILPVHTILILIAFSFYPIMSQIQKQHPSIERRMSRMSPWFLPRTPLNTDALRRYEDTNNKENEGAHIRKRRITTVDGQHFSAGSENCKRQKSGNGMKMHNVNTASSQLREVVNASPTGRSTAGSSLPPSMNLAHPLERHDC